MAEKNTKEKLLEAAIELFSVKGYSGTGVDEIAESIGLKGPNLYKYYKGKSDLLNEIVKKADEVYEKGLGDTLKSFDTITCAKDLKDITLQTVSFTIDNEMGKKMRRIYSIEQFRSEMLSDLATRHQLTNMADLHEKLFKRLIKEGVMVKGDAKIYALEFVAPVTLMIQLSDRNPNQKDYAIKTIKKHINVFTERYFIK